MYLQDGVFTLGEMECMGSCVTGPMIAVADYTKGTQGFTYTYYEDLTPSTAVKVLEDLRAGKTPKVGMRCIEMGIVCGFLGCPQYVMVLALSYCDSAPGRSHTHAADILIHLTG